jgi:hypothetical protein
MDHPITYAEYLRASLLSSAIFDVSMLMLVGVTTLLLRWWKKNSVRDGGKLGVGTHEIATCETCKQRHCTDCMRTVEDR